MLALYEGEISTVLQSIRDGLDDAAAATTPGADGGGSGAWDSAAAVETLESLFSKATQAVKQLDAEARTQADATSRKALQSKVRLFKDDVKAERARFRGIKEAVDRDRLLAGAGRGPGGGAAGGSGAGRHGEADRMLNVEGRMQEGTSSLEQSRRTMMEIEQTAIDVSDQLSQNRATILSTKSKIDATNSLTGQARQVLRRLEHNERVKQLCGYAAVAAVGVGFLVMLFTIFFGS